jgi:MFS family permease
MWTVREPKRRGLLAVNAASKGPAKAIPIRTVVAFMRENASTFVPFFVGMGIQTVLLFGTGSWAPAFYIRTFHWTPAKFGLVQGTLMLTSMPLGAIVGSLLAERFAKKGYDDANMRVVLIASVLAMPGAIIAPLMPTATLAITISAIALFCQSWVAGPINAALQIITPNQMRGQITALFLFVFNVIGFGLGPTAVAVFTDYVFRSESQIGRSLSATAATLAPLGVLMIWLSLKPYARSVAKARAWS